MKILVVFKCQRFKDNRSDKTESRSLKCQRLDIYDNEKGERLDKFEDKGERENIEYVPFSFIASLFSRKESNRLTDMGEGTKSLNHFVCILKIG